MIRYYNTSISDVSTYLDFLIDNSNFKPSYNQRIFLIELYSRMNEETVLHCVNSIKFADEFIQRYNEKGNDFERDFKMKPQDFMLGIAIHDVGKISIPKKVLETLKPPTIKQWKILDAHAGPNGHEINDLNNILNVLNKKSETNFSLESLGFTSAITDIAVYHHPQKVFNQLGLDKIYGVAQIVDISEALSGFRKYIPNSQRKTPPQISDFIRERVEDFLDYTGVGLKGKTANQLFDFANETLDVVEKNKRYFTPLENKISKISLESIKNLFTNLKLNYDMNINLKLIKEEHINESEKEI